MEGLKTESKFGAIRGMAEVVRTAMLELEQRLSEQKFEGNSGVVKVVIQSSHIIDIHLTGEKPTSLEILIEATKDAINEAIHRREEWISNEVGAIQSGLNLPKDFKMPF